MKPLFLSLCLGLTASVLSAQILMSGEWVPMSHEDAADRGPGPELYDYPGYPINNAARLRAESWDASRLTMQEQQCRVHIAPYIYRGPMALRIWEEKDPDTQQVVAIRHYISTYEQNRTIWMDGRPHPPAYAPHTWMGFSTGKWEGRMLTVTTTHLKMGWLRRNGLAESDEATMVEHFVRHGDLITQSTIITDPVYLTEPVMRTQSFGLNLNQNINWLWPCEYVTEVANQDPRRVPHYLPGKNPFLKELLDRTHLPEAGVKGGPETAYPEFRDHMVASSHEAKLMHPAGPKRGTGKVEVYAIQNNVFLIAGAGSNITAQVGPQGVVLVDGGTGAVTAEVMAAVRSLPIPTTKPVRILINTSGDADHAGGNEEISTSAGVRRGDIALVNTPGSSAMNQVKIFAHENVLNRMSAAADGKAGGKPAVNVDNWPTDTFFDNEKEVYFNGEAVKVHHIVNAHTDGDVIVHFRKADVVATGDIYMTDSYPVIDLAKGGSLQGIIDGLNMVLEIAVPAHHEEGGTMIVPGHGRIADEADLAEYRDMLTIFRDRIQDMIKRGMSLEQIKAARPTMDYDPEYGSTSGPWTIDMFVEAMYGSIKNPPAK